MEAEDTSTALTLSAGSLTAQIVGGDLLTVRSLRYRGVELLVDPGGLPDGYRVHRARAGITLLHPWANRLGEDVFTFAGRSGRLDDGGGRVSRDAHGLAIHGLIPPEPWSPRRLSAAAAVASLTWLAEPGFPFAHQIVVACGLLTDPDGAATLSVQTRVTALADGPVPVALGWHPYLARGESAEIELPRLRHLGADHRGLPDGSGVVREPSRIALADETLDYGVDGLAPGSRMTLHNAEHRISLELQQGYPCGQVFAPSDAPVVSLEPMTARTDALRRGQDLPVAAPERPFTATFSIRVCSLRPSPELPGKALTGALSNRGAGRRLDTAARAWT